MKPAIHYPSGDAQGPFTAKVGSGNIRRIISQSSASLPPFEFTDQAIQWCVKECSRLQHQHPGRRWTGTILDRHGTLHQIAFSNR